MAGALDLDEAIQPLRIYFGGASALPTRKNEFALAVDVPLLAGEPKEEIFPALRCVRAETNFFCYEVDDWLIGTASEVVAGIDIEARTAKIYQRILQATAGRHLYRVWNYVPRINGESSGLENYRGFCRGRALTLETAWGSDFKPRLPAGSAVGSSSDQLQVIFAAGKKLPRHFENPAQVPAYDYPPEHGPRPPSFARATSAEANGVRHVFISGTSAIKGHATVAPGILSDQIDCTLDNLRLISSAAGLGDDLGAKENWTRHFKIYLRRTEDLLAARAKIEPALLTAKDRVSWLRADICRSALSVEIEATLVRPT